MKTTTEIKDVFAAYGEAVYNTHIMEYDLVSIWILDSIRQRLTITQKDLLDFQTVWSKKTFGQLLKPLITSNIISPEIKDFL
jgi:hypothetical protein